MNRLFSNCLIVATIGSLSLLTAAHAREIYLSADGDDVADGSKERPWRILGKINSMDLAPGDQVLLHAGHTFAGPLLLTAEDAGTAESPVSILTWPHDDTARAIINAGDGTGIHVINAAGINIRSLEIAGNGPGRNFGSGIRFVNDLPGATRLKFVSIQQVVAHGFAGRTDRLKTMWQGKEYRVAEEGHGIAFGFGVTPDDSASGYDDVLIEDCEVYENQHTGVNFEQPQKNPKRAYAHGNIMIRRVKAHHNLGDPEFVDNHSGSGIFLNFCDTALIEHCEAWENGALCKSNVGGPVGIWTHASRCVVIRHCHSHHNRSQTLDGGGFDFDAGVSDSTIEFCHANDNSGAGLLVYTYGEAPLRMAHNHARHNVFENNSLTANQGEVCINSHGGEWDASNSLLVENNLLIAHGENGKACAFKLGDNEGVGMTGILIRKNTMLSRAGAPFVRGFPGVSMRWQENQWLATDPISSPAFQYGLKPASTVSEWKVGVEGSTAGE